MKQQGLSFIEVIVGIAFTSMIFSITLPSYSHLLHKTQLAVSSNELYASLSSARSKAVAMKSRVTIRAKTTWHLGWQIFEDSNENGALDAGEHILEEHDELSGVKTISSSTISNYISYTSIGDSRSATQSNTGSFQAGNIKLCATNGSGGVKLTLSRGGRIRTSTLSSSDCQI